MAKIKMPYVCERQLARSSTPFPCGTLPVCSVTCKRYPEDLRIKKLMNHRETTCLVCGKKFTANYNFTPTGAPRTCPSRECKREWEKMDAMVQDSLISERAKQIKIKRKEAEAALKAAKEKRKNERVRCMGGGSDQKPRSSRQSKAS